MRWINLKKTGLKSKRLFVRLSSSVAAVAILLFAITSHAQPISVRCNFSGGVVSEYDSGPPRSKSTSDISEMVFDQIDPASNTARLIGNVGASTVRAIHGAGFVHLIEITGIGNMNLTTIYHSQSGRSRVGFPVVHSRHIMTPSGPLPSQYVGLCRQLL
jgi:hypothetical protein